MHEYENQTYCSLSSPTSPKHSWPHQQISCVVTTSNRFDLYWWQVLKPHPLLVWPALNKLQTETSSWRCETDLMGKKENQAYPEGNSSSVTTQDVCNACQPFYSAVKGAWLTVWRNVKKQWQGNSSLKGQKWVEESFSQKNLHSKVLIFAAMRDSSHKKTISVL